MNKTLNLQKNLIIFGVPFLIIGLMVLISKSSIFASNTNNLSIGITFDLLLTVPIVYFLLIRKTTIAKITIIPFLIIGVVVCTLILPQENQYYLNFFKTWLFPIVELFILSFVLYHVRKAIKHYKLNKNKSFDFFTTLKNTSREILPKGIVIPIVTEIAVFYYGFIYWKKRPLKHNEFTYHKNSGTITLLIAIIFIIAIETFVLHTLLEKWNSIAAWGLTFLSIYSGIQCFGFLKSMLKRPILIDNDRLYLRYGIMSESTIHLKNIDSVELSSKDYERNKASIKLSILGELESHNVIIHLKEENTITRLYGIKRKYKNLALYVDDNVAFKNRIAAYKAKHE
ncbi:hypothetical protein [uncultured Algibacter sp.]|uniref:hypothetical protein n=1 Tax=uncultured Algibacter sp. TaxID=298659 RepID=UPI003216EC0A